MRAARAASQLLGAVRVGSAAEVVATLCAVQGQDVDAGRLAFRARTTGLTPGDVDAGLVRTWLMRGTLQYVAASDVGWLLALLGPRNQRRSARRRAQLGLDDELCARALPVLREVLADGGLDRAALRGRLVAGGVPVPAETQAMPHLLAYAAAEGVLSLGPEVSHNRPTYRLLAVASDSEVGLGELARRYLRGHQPAGPADLAAWSGLTLGEAKRAFALLGSSVLEVDAEGGPFWALDDWPGPARPDGTVRMVGHFDPYLLGYADRTLVVPEPHTTKVRTGGGFVTPTVLVDGEAVAIWRLAGGHVTLDPFGTLSDGVRAGIDAELADITRFVSS